MKAVITDTIRDTRTGISHIMGETVTIMGTVPDTIRGGVMYKVQWRNNTTDLLKPGQIKIKEAD